MGASLSDESSLPRGMKPPVRKIEVFLVRLYAVLLALLGIAMFAGGVRLAMLGGSLYYVLAGSLVMAAALLLFLRRRQGAWLFGLTLAATIAWSIWEVGFDGWALLPRLLMMTGLGLWLLMPWTQRALAGSLRLAAHAGPLKLLAVGLVAAVAIGWGAHDLFGPEGYPDPRFQTGMGAFPRQANAVQGRETGADWPYVGAERGGGRFTPLTQITPANVSKLKVAWSVDIGTRPGFNATPIKVGDTLYTCNGNSEVFALDAATGRQRWHYDASQGHGYICRGVAYHAVPGAQGLCSGRILTANSIPSLIALDARTGQPCPGFGRNGYVDLLAGMGKVIPGYYRVTSAPAIVRGRVVVGGLVNDNQYWGVPSGVIRAFDVVTGELAWAWDMGHPERTGAPPPGETYTHSTPNSWAPMSADEELGLVYVPLGNPSGDQFSGRRRPFDRKYGSSVVALDALTGRPRWSFQTVHNDIWDYDVASPAALVDLTGPGGEKRRALVQAAKRGEIYILDRATGKPIFPVTERPVPRRGHVPEEHPSPTQPFSDAMPSFRGPRLTEQDMWGVTPLDQLYCRIQFKESRHEGIFTPPGLTPSVDSPMSSGSINQWGVTIDPVHNVMVLNTFHLATRVQLVPRKEVLASGKKIMGPWASGREMLGLAPQMGTPYGVLRDFWLNPLRVPCTKPPFGRLHAVDLNTGKLLWTRRLGTARGSGALGISVPFAIPLGTPLYGGATVTRSGLVFIGATKDGFFQAFDLRTGDLLWRASLPGGGNSSPISYAAAGRQYVVIAAAGSYSIESPLSTKLVAFALPKQAPK
ncbi:MAG TPA: membrane-bound PQQ-dependent dehydrogenase, glucose/quinate/shikimate family [Novosphingobium sp.]|nr:membrane-bound PQQ-dependent dehydrogenase, glucose/quinate/shikimate family [Novosphingobium sp.]